MAGVMGTPAVMGGWGRRQPWALESHPGSDNLHEGARGPRCEKADSGLGPSQCPSRQGLVSGERGCDGGSTLCMSLNNDTLFLWHLGFLHKHFQLQTSSLLSPQAISSQPAAVLCRSLLSKPQVPAPTPCAHWGHTSGWGAQGCDTDHLCRSHSVLPATDRLLRSPPLAPEALLLSQLIPPPLMGLPWMWEPLLSFNSPHPWAPVQSCFLSSSISLLLSFLLLVTQGSFLSF